MSDLLVHWACFEDLRRLAQRDPRMDETLARILEEERETARLGAITRYGSKWVPAILHDARRSWDETPDRGRLMKRVAFALGGIAHFPPDTVLKPVMSELAQADWNSAHVEMQQGADRTSPPKKELIREVSAYFDTHVFREVYFAGNEEPFNQFLFAVNRSEPGAAAEAFVRSLFQRALLACHTFDPGKDPAGHLAWLDRLLDTVQPLYLDLDLYTRVVLHPDPAKMEAFGVTTTFYRREDPLILVARKVHRGEAVDPAGFDAAMREGANASHYGKCLEIGLRCLREASAFWRGERSEPPDIRQWEAWKPRA